MAIGLNPILSILKRRKQNRNEKMTQIKTYFSSQESKSPRTGFLHLPVQSHLLWVKSWSFKQEHWGLQGLASIGTVAARRSSSTAEPWSKITSKMKARWEHKRPQPAFKCQCWNVLSKQHARGIFENMQSSETGGILLKFRVIDTWV